MKYTAFIFLILNLFSFETWATNPTVLKKEALRELSILEQQGFSVFGQHNPILVDSWKEKIINSEIITLKSSDFDRNPKRSRLSAFYVKGTNQIYINGDQNLAPILLLHEIIQDRKYEITSGLSLLLEILSDNHMATDKKRILLASIKAGMDLLIDNHGVYSESFRYALISQSLAELDKENSTLQVLRGGDVVGGGGDDWAFKIKNQVFLKILSRVYDRSHEQHFDTFKISQDLTKVFYLLTLKLHFEAQVKSGSSVNSSMESSVEYNLPLSTLQSIASAYPASILIPRRQNPDQLSEQITQILLGSRMYHDLFLLRLNY